MTQQRQNEVIAEALGWVKTIDPLGYHDDMRLDTRGTMRLLPNYVADLNAMAEVEKELGKTKMEKYNWELWRGLVPGQYISTATAAQRAEAFLKTIGKWEAKA